jgi:hypothetical protein
MVNFSCVPEQQGKHDVACFVDQRSLRTKVPDQTTLENPAPSVLLGAWHLYYSKTPVETFLDNARDSAGLTRSPKISCVLVEKTMGEEHDLLAALITELLRPPFQVRHDTPSLPICEDSALKKAA